MKILFISHLTNSISAGPNYSVPAQIKAQSKYDEVFWWNLTDACQEFWLEGGLYNSIKDYPELKISSLPSPFNNPDLVVFETIYFKEYLVLAKECKKRKIPYVIVPRSGLTKQGQKQKKLKKIVANFLFFNSFIKGAAAIQYLTKSEQRDSGIKWNKNSLIIPNGIDVVDFKRTCFEKECVSGVCIGRFAIYQKGLDMLYSACFDLQEEMRKNSFSISLHGPERFGEKAELIERIKKDGLGDVLIVKDGVFGEEKAKVLKEADFFIMTSRFEGLPMALIEAMSYSLPCFVTEGTFMAEEVNEYNAGWTCETNVESIKNCLITMMNEKDKLNEKGENARRLSLNYSWDEIAKVSHESFEYFAKKGN